MAGEFMTDDTQATLFAQNETEAEPAESAAKPETEAESAAKPELSTSKVKAKAPRINRPERCQVEGRFESLDDRLDFDHDARLVWKLVEGLDLSSLYEQIDAVEGGVGRNASDPRVLFALWLYAAVDSVGSAREVERLCKEHRAYEWLCGRVPVNYHMLADFRVQHGKLLKELQTESLAGMLAEGLISLETVAQDGLRVRASAGSSSFRRLPTLEEALKEAREHLEKLEKQSEESGEQTVQQKKARERAARERCERVEKAIDVVKQMAEQREKRKKGDGVKTRASTTDPETRNMKMGDGGFRPAVNVQIATDVASGIILNMDVTNEGSDAGQMKPMMDEIKSDLGQVPEKALVDGGYSSIKDIEATTQGGTTVFAPVKEEEKQKSEGKDPFAPKPGDSPIIAAWRVRMGTEAAKELYKMRPQTAELTNARIRNQGVYQVNVRGLVKIKAALSWHILAINLLRAEKLRAAVRAKSAVTSKVLAA
jgi:transposase